MVRGTNTQLINLFVVYCVLSGPSLETVAASTIDSMRQNPKANIRSSENHLRKGGAGGWRDVYTVRESEAYDEIYRQQMEGTGLRMDLGEGLVMP